jgi:molybdopterin-guanine dinucleotide biosynthesis adapter protein
MTSPAANPESIATYCAAVREDHYNKAVIMDPGSRASLGCGMTAMRIIGLAGWSGSGKTTLVTKVIPVLARRGLKIATVKHAHHEFDIDQPGKDSWLHRQAGASEVAIVSSRRWAMIHELGEEPEPQLADILQKLSPVDLVIVEGFKRQSHPKLEVYRACVGKPLLHPDDDCIVAVATDAPLPQASLPVLMLDDIEGIADMLQAEALPPDRIGSPPETA